MRVELYTKTGKYFHTEEQGRGVLDQLYEAIHDGTEITLSGNAYRVLALKVHFSAASAKTLLTTSDPRQIERVAVNVEPVQSM